MNDADSHPGIGHGEAGTSPMHRYLLGLAVGATLPLALLAAIAAFLAFRGTLPPPQISNSLCLDEKLTFMRESPPQQVNFLVVGSSVAWRHFNSPAAVRANPAIRPYNAGFCGASTAQTEAVTRWLVDRTPTVKRVLLIASPMDFEDCSADALSTFDVSVADRYVFKREPLYTFYLHYFDPATLIENARGLGKKRSDRRSFDSLVMDRFGDAPLEPEHARELLYGKPKSDRACFVALRRTASELDRRAIGFDVALTPLHPAWTRKFDHERRSTGELRRMTGSALAGTHGRLILPGANYPEKAFFDAIHLRWSYTPALTREMVQQPRSAHG